MAGEIDEVSLKIGALTGTTETLVKQNSALFRQHKELGDKIDKLTQSFTGYSQQTLAAIAGSDKRILDLEEAHPPMDKRVDDLETFQTQTEEVVKIKDRRTLYLFGAAGATGGLLSQIIDFLKSIGHS